MDMDCVKATQLGMDIRAGYKLYVDEDCIIVDKRNDQSLQYYGGMEYVDKEFRSEIGDYVIYLSNAGRVADCLDAYYSEKEEEE